MLATEFLTTLQARVDWLDAKVQDAEAEWAAYTQMCAGLVRSSGPRPASAGESWIDTFVSWISGPTRLIERPVSARAQAWQTYEQVAATTASPVFAELRSAVTWLQQHLAIDPEGLQLSSAQTTAAQPLATRGEALLRRAETVHSRWQNSFASKYDRRLNSVGAQILRQLFDSSPAARWGGRATAALASRTYGSETGVDPDDRQRQPQGLPPWVAPVVGGILVVGVGYALWQYSKTH